MNKSMIVLLFCASFALAESKNFLAKEEADTLFTEFDDDLEEVFLSHYLGLDDGNEDGLDDFSIERRLLIPESNEASIDDESLLINEEDAGVCGDDTEATLPAKGSCITVTHCYLTDIPRIGKRPVYKTKVVCN